MNDFEKPLMDLAFDLQLTQTVHEDLSQCLAVITQKKDFLTVMFLLTNLQPSACATWISYLANTNVTMVGTSTTCNKGNSSQKNMGEVIWSSVKDDYIWEPDNYKWTFTILQSLSYCFLYAWPTQQKLHRCNSTQIHRDLTGTVQLRYPVCHLAYLCWPAQSGQAQTVFIQLNC